MAANSHLNYPICSYWIYLAEINLIQINLIQSHLIQLFLQTIDNDVDLIDRSFGFTTSVEAAQAAIVSAKTEARCNLPNGIGETDM